MVKRIHSMVQLKLTIDTIKPAFPIPLSFWFFPIIEHIRPAIEKPKPGIERTPMNNEHGHIRSDKIPNMSPSIEVTGGLSVLWLLMDEPVHLLVE